MKLIDKLREDMVKSMNLEVSLKKESKIDSTEYVEAVAQKTLTRMIISMLPEINIKPDKAEDKDIIILLKKYINIEKTRLLYTKGFINSSMAKNLNSKDLKKLEKNLIENSLDNELTSPEIKIAMTYLPKTVTEEEIIIYIKTHIDFTKFKSKFQAIKLITEYFNGNINGSELKKIIEGL